MMTPTLELDLLKVFVTAVERGGFSRAAAALHRTQSAVSMQIQRLERTTGTRLFARNGRHVRLTREGEALLGYARRMLTLGEEALGAIASNECAGMVRLGVLEDYATRAMPKILAKFWAAYPLVQVDVRTGLTAELLERLGTDFDLVLGMQPAGSGRGTVIHRDRPVWVAAGAYDIHKRAPLPLALYPDGCLFRRWGTRALEDAGRTWRCAYVSPSSSALLAAVRAGLAVSIFRRSTLAADLRSLSPAHGFPKLPEIEIALYTTENCSRAANRLAGALVEHLRNNSAG
jgi:DNA-binding transcriptional LysR family regulator